jgi:hypothetical protein
MYETILIVYKVNFESNQNLTHLSLRYVVSNGGLKFDSILTRIF